MASEVKIKIAIPLFKDRVSPHFGSSSKVLLLEIHGATVCQEAMWDMGGENPMDMARRLVDLGVEKIICGGIQYYYKNWLTSKGIMVIDNQRGIARELIQQMLKDRKDLFPREGNQI